MLAIGSTVKVVVFSACLSGLSKATNRGDVLGLLHAVLAAGANIYIGALWHSNDLATIVHMFLFYWDLIHHEDRVSIATLWHRATLALFSLKKENSEGIIGMVDAFVNGRDAAEEEGLRPGTVVRNGRRKLLDLKDEIESSGNEFDFTHPCFWAPFIIMGNAEQYYMAQIGDRDSVDQDSSSALRERNEGPSDLWVDMHWRLPGVVFETGADCERYCRRFQCIN